MLIWLVLLGLIAGWILRSRVGRSQLPLVIALAFAPAVVHGVGTTWWALSVGVDPIWVAGFAALWLLLVALAWWWLRRTAPVRPFLAPLAVPAQAFLQFALTSLLGRAATGAGAAVDVLPGVAMLGATLAIGAALLVMLPTREHFPRLGLPTAPRWWTALGRAGRNRRR
jgi:hypothetical protein